MTDPQQDKQKERDEVKKRINDLVKSSEILIKWIDTNIYGLSVPSDDRTRLAVGCFTMTLEHHKAIVLLVSNSHFGSALALCRLIYESYIRGVWLAKCAKKTEVEKFKRNKLDKNFSDLISDIEKVNGYEDGTLSQIKKTSWNIMNSFTHSGIDQIARRFTKSSIEPNYDEVEILDCLKLSSWIGLQSALQVSLIAKNNTVKLNILNKIIDFPN